MNSFDEALKHITEAVNEEGPDYSKMFKPVDRTMDSSAHRRMDRARAEKLLAQEGSLETDEAKQILHELWRDKGAVVARATIEWFKRGRESRTDEERTQ